LLVVAASLSISPAVRQKLPFDVIRDFAPVSQLVDLPHLLVVHPSVPAHSVKEPIALANPKSGELNYASSGTATSTHMAAEFFSFASAHDFKRMRDPKLLALRKRIRALGDPELTDAQRRWRCVMEIELKNGRILKHQTMAAKGSFENPLTRAEEDEKALDLLAPVLGARRSTALLETLWNIEQVRDVRALRALYC